ncbi:MAG: hypothetical protein KNN13_09785 [Hydrogenobacter thermophilus]|mgnify:CR=1 FL=1|uniref:hypothetical protein n=1 Tax=Hydrogenobacter thermophilus TaxID=940 RepID=UPI001C758985|nr:hypothetical protein [Hydrogenobacter thermophilus]QWK19745.1 MAG: hypothetical protein KNN13_09785 [Hydrogenobacter thermophilus]
MYRLQSADVIEKIISQRTFSVGTTPTKLDITPNTRVIVIENSGTTDVYFGNNSVSTSTGISIKQGEIAVFTIKHGIEIFFVAGSPTIIKILEAY